jgi:SAM-dependent methyltransferase
MSESFKKYGDFYDHLYLDKDYEAETKYVSNLLKSHKGDAQTIIEFGSGTGIHGRLFGDLGYSVLGVEPSETMLEKSVNTANFTSQLGDIRYPIDSSAQFDTCLVLFHVFNYLLTKDDQVSAFKNIHSLLKPGSLLALEVWHGPAVAFQKPETRIKTVRGDFGEIVRIASPTHVARDRVDITYDIFHRSPESEVYRKFSEIHSLRPTYSEDIEDLATLSGFEVLLSEQFLTSKPVAEDTWSVLYLLRRN